MFHNKKGDAVLVLFIYLTFLFFMMIIAALLYLRLAANQTVVDNICAEAAARIQWENVESKKYLSQNEGDNKRLKYNNLKMNEEEAAQIVIETFAENGFQVKNVKVYLQDFVLNIEGDVQFKTRNVLKPGNNDFPWVHFRYKTRLYKNHL